MIDDPQPEPSDTIPVEPSDEAIRQRSQQIWEREGHPEGRAQEHWQRAKAELEAEQDLWVRARAELAAQMEKTLPAQLAEPAGRTNDLHRSNDDQAGALMPKALRLTARSTGPLPKVPDDDIETDARALSRETPARRSDVAAGPHSPPWVTAKLPKQTSAAPSIISADIVLHGDLESSGDIHLDGCVVGSIRSASLVVEVKAVVQGEAVADEVIVRGCVRGSVRARKVHLCANSRVEGDILYGTLTAEAGAQIEGQFRHADDPLSQENAPAGAPEESVAADTPTEDVSLFQATARYRRIASGR